MLRRPSSDPSWVAQSATRSRRPERNAKSKRLLNRLLLGWLGLLGGVLLMQACPFLGSTRIGGWLLVALVLGMPLGSLLMLWLVLSLELREAYQRVRVLRRAAKWKPKEPSTAWLEQEWNRH